MLVSINPYSCGTIVKVLKTTAALYCSCLAHYDVPQNYVQKLQTSKDNLEIRCVGASDKNNKMKIGVFTILVGNIDRGFR